jgi:hypothetical protein
VARGDAETPGGGGVCGVRRDEVFVFFPSLFVFFFAFASEIGDGEGGGKDGNAAPISDWEFP